MKVFLSWSGDTSHKVAIVFRDWFPSVIQSLEPYVSSEDIDKGARWTTDIAQELADSSFGILCVTRENIGAAWLNFEAGALSKTIDKSYVSPFLFDIKRSEIDGPILQFQSTVFEKDDIKKLVRTLNKACGDGQLPDDRLDKAFDVWYPTLHDALTRIPADESGPAEETEGDSARSGPILEEILELSRLNQKLLRNPDANLSNEMRKVLEIQEQILKRLEDSRESLPARRRRKFHPGFIEELMHMSPRMSRNLTGFQIALSFFRNDYPWIYDAGTEVVRTVRSTADDENKRDIVGTFLELLDFTFQHPMMRDLYPADKEMQVFAREMSFFLRGPLERFM